MKMWESLIRIWGFKRKFGVKNEKLGVSNEKIGLFNENLGS